MAFHRQSSSRTRSLPRLAVLALGLGLLSFATAASAATGSPKAAGPELVLVVMDPLAAPLACECVKGHAQRQYDRLARFLEQRLGRPVKVFFSEDLVRTVRNDAPRVDLVVGKHSLVKYDAAQLHLPVHPIAMLTAKDGTTTVTGLFIVPKADPARKTADLRDYTIYFGEASDAEKHAAAKDALKQAGLRVPAKVHTSPDCSDAAMKVLENHEKTRAAGVISSYATPLLEGCGTVPKGALRVVRHDCPGPLRHCLCHADRHPGRREGNRGCPAGCRRRPGLAQGDGMEERVRPDVG